jgi:hypothetical protein
MQTTPIDASNSLLYAAFQGNHHGRCSNAFYKLSIHYLIFFLLYRDGDSLVHLQCMDKAQLATNSYILLEKQVQPMHSSIPIIASKQIIASE